MNTINDSSVILYGIPNCDTVKKARHFLTMHFIEYNFWNYAIQGVPLAMLEVCLAQYAWQTVCNTKGLTWRQLPDAVKIQVTDSVSAIHILKNNPSAIKRPIVCWGETYHQRITFGFDALIWADLIKTKTKVSQL
jgi:arsenate reductase (glutaredoxin)